MIKHDSGKQRWDFLPFDALNEVVKVYTWGHEVKGYGPDNWKTVEPRDRYFAALMRHIHEWREGNKKDHESKIWIMAHVIFNAMCLLWFDMKSDRVDDVNRSPNTAVIDPCDYDQGSYMYMRCGNCIKIDCNRLDEAIKTIASQGYRCVQKEQCAGGQCHCMTCPSYQWGEL